MTDQALKYQKRAWHKQARCKVVSVQEENGFLNVIFAFAKKQLKLTVFREELKEEVRKLSPNTKLTIWFTVSSKKSKDRWYTNAHLNHYEYPQIKKKEPQPSLNKNTIPFGGDNPEFE